MDEYVRWMYLKEEEFLEEFLGTVGSPSAEQRRRIEGLLDALPLFMQIR
jgi:hypothetical protein